MSAPVQLRSVRASPSAQVHTLPWQGNDDSLFRLLQQQTQSSMRLLYERFSKQVHGLTWRVLGPDAEHDDVVQEVFEQVFLGIDKLRDPSSLTPWVTSVTLNVARAALRKRRVRRFFGLASTHDETAADASYTHDFEARDLLAKIYRVLNQLPTEERVLFVLRYLEQRPVHEVAELCGYSRATANRKLSRAVRLFKRHASNEPGLAERITSNDRRML
jgi:RNA polymerase sigma-70 factor (ECF subfamily)